MSIRIRRRSAILNLLKSKFFMAYPYLKHILLNSNGLAILSGFPDITHLKKKNTVRILPNFEPIRAISEMDVWYKFWSNT